MYKHTQEKEAEKYVNLKQLANVSELTSPGFGLLVFILLGRGVKEGEAILPVWAGEGTGMKQEAEGCFFTLY